MLKKGMLSKGMLSKGWNFTLSLGIVLLRRKSKFARTTQNLSDDTEIEGLQFLSSDTKFLSSYTKFLSSKNKSCVMLKKVEDDGSYPT
jgi:hypothetical protein